MQADDFIMDELELMPEEELLERKTEQDEALPEEWDTEVRRPSALIDVLTVQAIICICVLLLFFLIRMSSAGTAQELAGLYKDYATADAGHAESLTDFTSRVYSILESFKPLQPDLGEDTQGMAAGGESNSYEGFAESYMPPDVSAVAASLGSQEVVLPMTGLVTSLFGKRTHPTTGQADFHTGVDIENEPGTEIRAFAAGTVTTARASDSAGNYVVLSHERGLSSRYLHCERLLVEEGQSVEAGQVIATLGSTGNSTGPHLHFELRQDGVVFDPAYLYRFDT